MPADALPACLWGFLWLCLLLWGGVYGCVLLRCLPAMLLWAQFAGLWRMLMAMGHPSPPFFFSLFASPVSTLEMRQSTRYC